MIAGTTCIITIQIKATKRWILTLQTIIILVIINFELKTKFCETGVAQ
jgi:hypothetical protein